MNTFAKRLVLIAALGAISQQAAALTWSDRHPESGSSPLAFLYEEYPWDLKYGGKWTYSADFNILNDGFDPGKHVINQIKVWFAFADDQRWDVEEHIDIVVGDQTLWSNQEVDGDHSNAPYSYHWLSMNVTHNASIYSELSTNGVIDYSVTIKDLIENNKWWQHHREDTWLKIAKLKVKGDYKPVPDASSTLGLLGIALLGLGAARRRLRN